MPKEIGKVCEHLSPYSGNISIEPAPAKLLSIHAIVCYIHILLATILWWHRAMPQQFYNRNTDVP